MGPLIRSIFWKVPTPGHGAATGQRKPVGGWGGTAISTKQATAETVALLNICGHVQPACPGSRCPDGMVKIGAPEISPKGPVQARLSAARCNGSIGCSWEAEQVCEFCHKPEPAGASHERA